MKVSAKAAATVANQPSYDLGGFAVGVVETVAGESPSWETLTDVVEIEVIAGAKGTLIIENIVAEEVNFELPTAPTENTAGIVVAGALVQMATKGIDFPDGLKITVRKGISIQGTGLGSSGATPAAALKALEGLMAKLGHPKILSDQEKVELLIKADRGVPDNSVPAYFGGLVEINSDHTFEKVIPGDDFGFFVIVTPQGFGIKTADARKVLTGIEPEAENQMIIEKMQIAIRTGDSQRYGELMEQAHQWFVGPRSRLYPAAGAVYDQVYQAAHQAGASGMTISGAGPTVLAVTADLVTARAVGMAIYTAFNDAGFRSVARIVEVDEAGSKLCQTP